MSDELVVPVRVIRSVAKAMMRQNGHKIETLEDMVRLTRMVLVAERRYYAKLHSNSAGTQAGEASSV